MKIALVYDRVNKWGGAERVLLVLNKMFPRAPLYTSVYSPKKALWASVFPKVITSFVQKVPFAKNRHEHFPYLMPLAFESLDFSRYDLVISVTSEAAKGIITKPGSLYICYCLTPTRYLWSGYEGYFKYKPIKYLSSFFIKYLKYWDKIAAQRPDVIVGISKEVQERIKRYYGRGSELIYPPVDIKKFQITNNKLQKKYKSQITNFKQKNYYLIVSRLVGYKKVDLAVDAFNILDLPLVIVGAGWQEGKLKKMAKKNIRFVGLVSDEELITYYQSAKALIMPQEEDFGLVSVEAQAAGCPVIAYKKGGVLETIIDGKTGILFTKQSVESLIDAVQEFNKVKINKNDLFSNTKRFSQDKFESEFEGLIKRYM